MYKNLILFLNFISSFVLINAQTLDREAKKGHRIVDFDFHYTYVEPAEDLALRFGAFNNIGFGAKYKTSTHWVLSAEICYQFGNNIKETGLFDRLVNSSGYITNTSGYPAQLTITQRGISSFVNFGRVFPLTFSNRNTGILVTAGGGYYMHKININSKNNDIPVLTDELMKGYDRLSGGPAFQQFVGFVHHSKNRMINFYIGIHTMQSFTTSFRGYNYDKMQPDTKTYRDFGYGIRFGWTIPIYLNAKKQDEFYYR